MGKIRIAIVSLLMVGPGATPARAQATPVTHDAHLHLTNYVQEGTDIRDFLKVMGDKVGRVALFGIPLQQTWA
ncbi:MAG TPA: amidohydrolase, partial [Vicinamibacteria bacterium]|nr:amidohydrolase [Vicinamibacteria bacterium]